MEPMKPMRPLTGMRPMDFGEAWWPGEMGDPSTSGAQNEMRYAVFPERRKLLIEADGQLSVYDTADHQITGVSQAQSHTRSLAFASHTGPVNLGDLQRLPSAEIA